jgi:dihydroorotate dehydrogenase
VLYQLLKPLLFRLDAERAHDLVSGLLRASARTPILGLLHALYAYDDPILAVDCAGLAFQNPLGLAAGFDKRGVLVDPMAALGFGHVEVGTVTPRPQPGNDRPRLFRLPDDGALINRLGFNSPGMVAVAQHLHTDGRRSSPKGNKVTTKARRLADLKYLSMPGGSSSLRGKRAYSSYLTGTASAGSTAPCVVGVNIGKNRATELERAAEDYLAAFVALAPLADYVTVNISSPNTPGLRQLHERAALEALLGELSALNRQLARPRPLFLKVSPDEPPTQIESVVRAGCASGIAGFVATNTTLARESLRGAAAHEAGGLSGRPLAARARGVIAQIHELVEGRVPVIGVGGVASPADAYAHIRAGASLIQLYTGLIYGGPGLPYQIKRRLAKQLRQDGYRSVAEAAGVPGSSG